MGEVQKIDDGHAERCGEEWKMFNILADVGESN